MKKLFLTLAFLACLVPSVQAQVILPDPGPSLDAWTFDEFDNARQEALIIKHNVELNAAMKDASTMESYIEAKRKAYLEYVVGDLPERTPLNAKTVKSFKEDGYKIESVVFQSMPGIYVSTLLFLPDGASRKNKVPGVLLSCGHSIVGKLGYSATAQYLAQNGIACLIVEPYGQGERGQFIDAAGNSLVGGSTTEHAFLAYSSMLTGLPLASRIFWDNSRGIDYLCSRPEINADAIGMAGNSGGGPQTTICPALDRRVKAAVVGHGSPYGWASTGADGCALMPFMAREMITLEDVILMAAPARFLFENGKKDFVRIGLSLDAIENIRKAYDALGYGRDMIENLVHEGGHEFYYAGQPNPQERLVRFFTKYLLGREATDWKFPGNTAPYFAGTKYLCTSSGEVLLEYPDAVSIPEDNVRIFDSYAPQRKAFMEGDRETVRAKIKEIIGYIAPEGDIKVEETVSGRYKGYYFKAFRLYREGQVPVPCALIVPNDIPADAHVNICLYDGGKNALLRSGRQMQRFLSSGKVTLLADLRGFGETCAPVFDYTLVTRDIDVNDGGDIMKSWNHDAQTVMSGWWTGNTLIAQRVADIETIVDYCGIDPLLKDRTIDMMASEHSGVVAVHATFLDSRINNLRATEVNKRYRLYLADPIQHDRGQDVAPGAVKYYDLADLIEYAGNIRESAGM